MGTNHMGRQSIRFPQPPVVRGHIIYHQVLAVTKQALLFSIIDINIPEYNPLNRSLRQSIHFQRSLGTAHSKPGHEDITKDRRTFAFFLHFHLTIFQIKNYRLPFNITHHYIAYTNILYHAATSTS